MEELVDHSSNQPTYTVVARRYRPKSFGELIGQDHVAQALVNAISTGRVGHAYLFTGARGVGKTSTARIFAKALSIPDDLSPAISAEIAAAIDAGDDMDVIEIDGASNRRIEEIRQLRSNVLVRPSRARFKIYIIDEVHMLTKEAFNALLKTLEEPPEHVKFIFCTTDPEKIPITILSRCQRFDFVPVQFEAIQQRLTEIAKTEGFEIQSEAVALLARRAAGSMRDSQSLLEQVMSFSSGTITADQVHAMLGTADESNLLAIVECLRSHDPLGAIAGVAAATSAGADPGQLTEQLLNFLRDLMTLSIGGGPQILKFANPVGYSQLKKIAEEWGVQTILSAIQILDESLVRMRASVSASTLLEVAMVQISQLEHLKSIPALLEALGSDTSKPPLQKKKLGPRSSPHFSLDHPSASALQNSGRHRTTEHEPRQAAFVDSATIRSAVSTALDEADDSSLPADEIRIDQPGHTEGSFATQHKSIDLLSQWRQATRTIEGLLSDYCQMVVAIDPESGNAWRVVFPPGAHQPRAYCDHPSRRSQLTRVVESHSGRQVKLSFEVQPGEAPTTPLTSTNSTAERNRKLREVAEHPLILKICELLDAEIVKVHSSHRPQSH